MCNYLSLKSISIILSNNLLSILSILPDEVLHKYGIEDEDLYNINKYFGNSNN